MKASREKRGNYAFIDGSNLHLCMEKHVGWKIDYDKFLVYLKEKYNVKKAFYFIGYLKENQSVYTFLQECGYILVFKPVLEIKDQIKGNCDADLVLKVMVEFNSYNQAVIVTSDGDFYSLVEYLYKNDKLRRVLSPARERTSELLTKKAREKIDFIEDLRNKIEYK